ncbi:hypothetical protein BDZ94DRAFT_1233870 [Collybia nuda]|uniref:Uncharacterized protein n=1 Tax=Collybia nuda TaxID=64659 RepID=A0A9P5YCB4_9AGAR|nr:hypothetical protein BDZ94DRAFT_1233870 [Collybia nuda]
MNATRKRKLDSRNEVIAGKRLKITTASGSVQAIPVTPVDMPKTVVISSTSQAADTSNTESAQQMTEENAVDSVAPKRPRINKLVPPRPFPTVPTSVSATGPRSAHKEGKNLICLTRKTPLGSYMRRCKDVILKDGYKTLYLSAMGAAIPHLLHLALALPPILPFSQDEIRTEVTTGTVEVQDEVIPDDEDEDITYRTRGKSTLKIVIKIGNGEFEGDRSGPTKRNGQNRAGNTGVQGDKGTTGRKNKEKMQVELEDVVFEEPEQEEMEML